MASFKEIFAELSFKRAPGPPPSFNIFDLLRVFRLLAERGIVGRGRISAALGIGEGATRTILDRLVDANLITISRRGCMLTERGRALWDSLRNVIPRVVELDDVDLNIARRNVAVLVRGRADRIKSGIEQRDAAISVGARGTVTMVYRGNRLVIPGVDVDVERSYPKTFDKIMRLVGPGEGDVVIISGGDDLRSAELGALAAAWSIV